MIYTWYMIFGIFPRQNFGAGTWSRTVILWSLSSPEYLGAVHISQTVQNMIHNLQTRQKKLKNTNQLELEIP